MNKPKIVISVIFVAFVAGFVIRGCLPKRTAPAPVGPAKMAIILDDWGNNYELVEDAIAVGKPLTLAILPHLPHSEAIAEEAHANRLGVMLHMPMQPKGKGSVLEPHTILTSTPDARVLRYLDDAVASIPHVEGVNNHQGSAAMGDARVMGLVLKRLKEKNMFFVDSKVDTTSVAAAAAREAGTRFTSRDVFLDNIVEVAAVKDQLRKAKAIALQRGHVVVIGHDNKITLQAIREMVPELEAAGITFVYAKDLVQ